MSNSRGGHIRGAGLLEVVIGAGILALVLTGTVFAFQFYLKTGLAATNKLQAAFLAEEGLEATRSIRDRSWDEFAALSSGTHHLVRTSQWNATSTAQLIEDEFTRTISVFDVYRRDSDMDIVSADSADPKTIDPDIKRVAALVTWGEVTETHVVFEDGTTDSDLASFPSDGSGDGDPVQSFTTPAEDVTVNKVDVYIKRASSTTPSDIYLEIRSDSAVGTVLGTSQTVSASGLADSLEWVTFSLSSDVELLADTEYFLRMRSNPESTEAFSGSEGTIHWGYQQSASSPYAGGAARRYVGRQGNTADEGQLLDQYDFSFRVRTEGVGGEVEAVTYLTNLFESSE